MTLRKPIIPLALLSAAAMMTAMHATGYSGLLPAAVAEVENDLTLTPMSGPKRIASPKYTVQEPGFYFENFETKEKNFPAGWKTIATPGNEEDNWGVATLGTSESIQKGVSGYQYAYILGNQRDNTPHDAWMFSPGIELEAGQTYTVEFYAYLPYNNSYTLTEKIEVKAGQGQTVEAMAKTLGSIDKVNENWECFTYSFTPATSGTYNLGFHSTSPARTNATLIDDIKVYQGQLPVLVAPAEVSIGETDTFTPAYGLYPFRNRGNADLQVDLKECSPEITIEGLPAKLLPGEAGQFKVTLRTGQPGDYTGHITLNTTDPTAPEFVITVLATVKDVPLTGYLYETFEEGGPTVWTLTLGSVNTPVYQGRNSARAWYSTTVFASDADNQWLGGVGFKTNYVDMGSDPAFKFWYKAVNCDLIGSTLDPTESDKFLLELLVSSNEHPEWKLIHAIEPNGDTPHVVSDDYQQVSVALPQYAGQICRFALRVNQVKGTIVEPFRVLIDDVAIGTPYTQDLKATRLTGPVCVESGNTLTHKALIENLGTERVEDYTVTLVNELDGKTIATSEGSALEAGCHAEVQFDWTPNAPGPVRLRALVECSTDNVEANNMSYPLNVSVLSQGNETITPGTGQDGYSNTPLNLASTEAMTQSLFLANEICLNDAEIHSLVLQSSFKTAHLSEPFSVYIAETDKSDFSDNEFIDPSTFTKVYEGAAFQQENLNDFVIPFDRPFKYNGGNLVVMTEKLGQEFVVGTFFKIKKCTVPRMITASASAPGSITPGNYPNTKTENAFPVAGFNMQITPAGTLQGKVTDGNAAVTGACVQVEGTQLTATTDMDGNFFFPRLGAGEVRLLVEAYGYRPLTSNQISLTANKTEQVELVLNELPVYSIHGEISDFAGMTVTGAEVTAKGYDTYHAFSDANGMYTIEGVYSNEADTYTLRLSHPYFEHCAEVVEMTGDLDMHHSLTPKPLPAENTQVSLQDDNATITWNLPYGEYSTDSGKASEFIGWPEGNSQCIFGTVYRNKMKIEKIAFYLSQEYGEHDDMNVIIFGLDEQGKPSPWNILYMEYDVPFNADGWTVHTLTSPVEADGFMVAVSCYGFMALGITEPTAEYPYEEGTQYFAGDSFYMGINSMSTYREANIMLRAYGNEEERYCSLPKTEYEIYRFTDGQQETDWEFIGSSDCLQFTDTGISTLPEEDYRYAVVSRYNVDIVAKPCVSDPVTITHDGVNSDMEENLSETQYYNLQGIRIQSPDAGQTVIIRKNNHAVKSVIR